LNELRLDEDFTDLLTQCLRHWTSAQGKIFRNRSPSGRETGAAEGLAGC